MPFFLLKRDDNDVLHLLTPMTSPSRQEALAELSRMTTEPGFDAWDGEVLLVDIDAALPVLLVRPAESTEELTAEIVAVPVEAPVESSEPTAEVEHAWPLMAAIEPDAVAAPADDSGPVAPIPAEEAEAFASYVSLAAEDEDAASMAVLADEEVSVVDPFYPVPELAMELEPEEDAVTVYEVESEEDSTGGAVSGETLEPAVAESYEPPVPVGSSELAEEPDDVGLREALERTTSAMAAETLASQAPDVEEAQPPRRAAFGRRWPWDSAPAPAKAAVDAPGASVDAEEPVAEPSDVAVQANDSVVEPHGAAVVEHDPLTPMEGIAVIPDVPAVEPMGVPAAMGEPVEEPPAADVLADAPVVEPLGVPTIADEPGEVEPAVYVPAAAVPDPMPTAAVPEREPAERSEFLADLEPIPTLEEQASAAETTGVPASVDAPVEPISLDGYVCADCVYEVTCPNKDQRLPKECGSFQWK